MSIGDDFTWEKKEEIFNRNFLSGNFVYLFCSFTIPRPKNKFLLILSVDPLILMFIVNSGINDYIKIRPALLDCQLKLKRDDYAFLDHDSYLACEELINKFTIDQVKAQVFNDMSRLSGKITKTTRNEIVKIVYRSRVLQLDKRVIILDNLNKISF